MAESSSVAPSAPVFPFGPFEHAAVYLTPDRVLHIRGDDARSWLNGQVTSDLKALGTETAIYVLSINVKGRILSDGWALERGADLALSLPEARTQAVLESFDKHIIMEDVEVALDPDLRVLTVQGPKAHAVVEQAGLQVFSYRAARLGAEGFDLWVPQAELEAAQNALQKAAETVGGALVTTPDLLNEAHVRAAVPRVGTDFGDTNYPQEAGLKQRAVSFNKGCYLGQEVICMLENRGQLNRRLVQLERAEALSVPPGTQCVDADGKRVGELTSVAVTQLPSGPTTLALAYLKRPLAEVGGKVRVGELEWAVRSIVGLSPEECPIIAQ